jgi:hypothetical protein
VLLLAAALALGVLGWALSGTLLQRGARPVGDGRHLASYGFDLSTLLVPSERLVPAGFPKDGLPALTRPRVLTPAEADAFAAELRRAHAGKFLVGGDRVIGVVVNDVARAYPLRVMNWHEVANDVLGGRPILVTYSPLCDSAVVFRREITGEAREFGVSGLVYNSNLVLYDRRPDAQDESLWSQLGARAIAGPAAAAGCELEILPAAVLPWSAWHAAHPDTTVLAPDPNRMKLYKRSYDQYLASDELHFPVQPLPPAGPGLKCPVLALRGKEAGAAWQVYTHADVVARAGAAGSLAVEVGGRAATLRCASQPETLWVEGADAGVQSVSAAWFAWYAFHPQAE